MIPLPFCWPAPFRSRLCWRSVAGLRHTAYGIRHTVAAMPRCVSAVKSILFQLPTALMLAALLGAPLQAQILSEFENRPVGAVRLLAEGPLTKITEADIYKLIELQPGEPYLAAKIALSLRRLHSSGVFFDIQVEAIPNGPNIDLTFHLYRKYLVRDLHLTGDPELPDRDLRREVQVREGEPYLAERLEEAAERLRSFYEASGYPTATVQIQPETDLEKAEVHVDFEINADNQIRFGALRFEIEGPATEAEVRKAFLPRKAFHLRASNRYTRARVEEGLQRLREHFALKGYLDSVVDIKDSNISVGNTRVDFVIRVILKDRIDIAIEGYDLSDDRRLELIPIYRERSADPIFLQESADNIVGYLQSKGYFQARVEHSFPVEEPVRRVEIRIIPGKRFSLTDVEFQGNQVLDRRELENALTIVKSSLFSRGRFTESQADDDIERIKQLYYRRGYLDVAVTHELVPQGEDVGLRFKIAEGPQYQVRNLSVDGNRTFPTEHIRALLRSQAGLYYSPSFVAEDRVIIINLYENEGYRDVQFRSDLNLDRTQHIVDIHYAIVEGSQYFIEDIIVTGNLVTREGVILRELDLEAGRPLSLEKSLQTESNLYNLGVFNQVNLETPSVFYDSTKRTLVVNVEEAKRRSLVYGAGFESEEGPRGTVGFSNSNFMGMARTLGLGLRLGRYQQRANVSYTLPRPLNLRLPTLISLFVQREKSRLTRIPEGKRLDYLRGKPFDSFRFTGLIQSEQRINRRTSLFYRYNFERVRVSNLAEGLTFDDIRREERPIRISSISASFFNDSRDDPIDPTTGTMSTADLTFTTPFLGSQAQFGRLFVQGQYYKTLLDRQLVVFASSLRIGVIQPFGGANIDLGSSNNRIPISQRFFAGGSTTLRGFRLDLAGPLRPATIITSRGRRETVLVPQGGNALIIANFEVRFPMYKFVRGALFYDTGNVFPGASTIHLNNFAQIVGVGLRVGTPAGAVRLDVGYNLHPGFKPDPAAGLTQPRRHIYFTIGQSF
ncbi:MAG: outer membrane protein assembly factor BamA [Acidobacteriota bacterium]